jgi:hypothetical protein
MCGLFGMKCIDFILLIKVEISASCGLSLGCMVEWGQIFHLDCLASQRPLRPITIWWILHGGFFLEVKEGQGSGGYWLLPW